MEDAITISIITPSYNQGRFLAATIESVIGQEGDFALDYIVVDGGSTDDSIDIIRHYERMLDKGEWSVKCSSIKFRWLSEQDRGQTDALMKGFRMAEGDILAWLNSDDLYLPGTLAAAAGFFGERPTASLLYGDAEYCDAAGNLLGRYPVEEFNLGKLAYFNFICQPSTFFSRGAFDEVGGLDVSLHFGMDYDLFVKLGKSNPCVYLPRCLSRFRLHDESKTMRNDILYENQKETLLLAVKHYDWAPINRVFGLCHYFCLSRLPRFLARLRPAVLVATACCTLVRYVSLNRGIRRADLKLLNLTNFRKVFKSRTEILQG